MMKPHGEWILTDDDSMQVRRQFYDGDLQVWELAEIHENYDSYGGEVYDVCTAVIDLRDYDDEEITEMIEVTYGRDVETVEHGEVAEMFFESGDWSETFRYFSRDDAINELQRMTGLDLSEYRSKVSSDERLNQFMRQREFDSVESFFRYVEYLEEVKGMLESLKADVRNLNRLVDELY